MNARGIKHLSAALAAGTLALTALLAAPLESKADDDFVVLLNYEASSATNEICQRTKKISREQCAVLFFEDRLVDEFEKALAFIKHCADDALSLIAACGNEFVSKEVTIATGEVGELEVTDYDREVVLPKMVKMAREAGYECEVPQDVADDGTFFYMTCDGQHYKWEGYEISPILPTGPYR